MVHSGFAEPYPLLLAEVEIEIIHMVILKKVSRPCTAVAVHHRMAVCAKPYRDTLLCQDLFDAVFHELSIYIQISRWRAANNIPQMLDPDHLPFRMLPAGIINKAHVVFQACGHILLPEPYRRKGPVAVEGTVFVRPLPVKFSWRGAQMYRQDTVACCKGILHNIS